MHPLVLVALVAIALPSGLFIHFLRPHVLWCTCRSIPRWKPWAAWRRTGLVLLARKVEWDDERLQGIASGLLGMGILEGFHAISSPDHGFVLLRSAASLLGAVAFSFVWHPPRLISTRTRALMPYLVGGATLAFGLLVVTMPHRLPRFTEQAQFLPTALALNGLAACLFFAGAAGFWIEAKRTGRPEHQLLGTLAILFGLAETMFLFSAPWQSDWWVWHGVRFAGYVIALLHVSRGYVRMVSDTRNALAEARRSARRLGAEYAVTRVLAETVTLKDVGHAVLQAIGETLEWELGMFWELDEQGQALPVRRSVGRAPPTECGGVCGG